MSDVEKIKEINAKVDEVLKTMREIVKRLAASPTSSGGVAPDGDLDGPHGNPAIKKDPKRWTGDSYAGCNYSDCPPEYLDVLAEFKDWQAGMDERKGTDDDKRKAKFNRLDAARARGWAQRLRSGYKAPERAPAQEDDVPF